MTGPWTPCRMRLAGQHVREADAHDLAEEVVELARAEGCPVLLTIEPGGGASIAPLIEGGLLADAMRVAPLSLVGVYTGEARIEDILADILAMPRGTECAP